MGNTFGWSQKIYVQRSTNNALATLDLITFNYRIHMACKITGAGCILFINFDLKKKSILF